MGKTILIVDDNRTILDLVAFTLQLDGFETITAVDGADALQRLEQLDLEKLGLIITDIVMPKLDGLSFIRQLRKVGKYQSLPILVLTARGLEEDEKTAINAGATGFIRKPFEPAELLAEVARRIVP